MWLVDQGARGRGGEVGVVASGVVGDRGDGRGDGATELSLTALAKIPAGAVRLAGDFQ